MLIRDTQVHILLDQMGAYYGGEEERRWVISGVSHAEGSICRHDVWCVRLPEHEASGGNTTERE